MAEDRRATTMNPVYRRAAVLGVPFGIYLSALTVMGIYADRSTWLGMLSLVMLVCIPLFELRYMRAAYAIDKGRTEFSALWLMGILMFIYGSIICGFVTYCMLQFVRPGFLAEQAALALKAYQSTPGLANSDMVTALQKILDENLLPRPIDVVFNLFWLGSFVGSLISAAVAGITKALPVLKLPKLPELPGSDRQ